jgi:hypothetical protein
MATNRWMSNAQLNEWRDTTLTKKEASRYDDSSVEQMTDDGLSDNEIERIMARREGKSGNIRTGRARSDYAGDISDVGGNVSDLDINRFAKNMEAIRNAKKEDRMDHQINAGVELMINKRLQQLVEEVAAERELTELISIVNESDSLNEGVMGNIGYKLMSFSLGILPEDHVDKIFNKVLTELPNDLSSQIKKKNPGRKEKVEALRAGLKKVITDKKGSELVNKSAKQLSSKIKSDLKKDPSLKEEVNSYEIEAIKQGVNSTSKGILRMIYSSIVSSIIGLIGQVFYTLGALSLSTVTLFTGAFIGIFGFVTGVGMIYKGKDLTESWVSADKLNEDIFVLPAVILGISGLLAAVFHGSIVNEPKYWEKRKEIVNELKDKDPKFAKMYTRSSELVGRKALNSDDKKELKSLVKNMNRIVKANRNLLTDIL